MYPLHDNDLDRLSRNAAEHYEMDFGSPGWEQLEKRLDQELPQKKDRRRFLFWLFFIVVTTGGALTGLLINSQAVTPLASNRMHTMPAGVVSTGETAGNNKPAADDKDAVAQTYTHDKAPVKTLTDKPDLVTGNKTVTGKQQRIGNMDKANDDQDKNIGLVPAAGNNKPVRLNNSRGTKTTNRKPANIHNTPAVAGNDISEDRSIAPNKDRLATTQQPLDKNDNTAIVVPPVDQPAQIPNTTAAHANKPPAVDSAAAGNKKPAIPHRYIQPLELGVVAGPDASMVSFGPLYKAGYNFGITVGYRFNERWSVNTGVIYTRKYYQADSNTFHAPKGSYWDRVLLYNVKGYCAMFDIPLNIRYDMAFNDKRRFFASAGASSYFMKDQNYNYVYSYQPGDSVRTVPYGVSKDAQHILSVLNLSVGYEKMIGKHFSIQAEPYLKIPLQGMGFGAMKIGSYGMFFSLKYRPIFKAKQPAGRK